jgi:predicted phosphoribosyltransferase
MAIEFKGERDAQQDIIDAVRGRDQGAMIAMAIYNGIMTVGGHVAEKLGYLLDEATRQLRGGK